FSPAMRACRRRVPVFQALRLPTMSGNSKKWIKYWRKSARAAGGSLSRVRRPTGAATQVTSPTRMDFFGRSPGTRNSRTYNRRSRSPFTKGGCTMPAKPIPDGFEGATPYLGVKDAARAIEFYKKAFGATEVMRMPLPDGKI